MLQRAFACVAGGAVLLVALVLAAILTIAAQGGIDGDNGPLALLVALVGVGASVAAAVATARVFWPRRSADDDA